MRQDDPTIPAPPLDIPHGIRLAAIAGLFGSAVLAFLVIAVLLTPGMCGCAPPVRLVATDCLHNGSGNVYRCTIENAETGVNFTAISAQVVSVRGEVAGQWMAPIKFESDGTAPVSASAPPLAPSSRIEDNGDGRFGVGDAFILENGPPGTLEGWCLEIAGGEAHGWNCFG